MVLRLIVLLILIFAHNNWQNGPLCLKQKQWSETDKISFSSFGFYTWFGLIYLMISIEIMTTIFEHIMCIIWESFFRNKKKNGGLKSENDAANESYLFFFRIIIDIKSYSFEAIPFWFQLSEITDFVFSFQWHVINTSWRLDSFLYT